MSLTVEVNSPSYSRFLICNKAKKNDSTVIPSLNHCAKWTRNLNIVSVSPNQCHAVDFEWNVTNRWVLEHETLASCSASNIPQGTEEHPAAGFLAPDVVGQNPNPITNPYE